jgi:hypothetical protein
MEITMKWQIISPSLLLVAATFVFSGCASTQTGGQQFAQANVQKQGRTEPPACPPKWVAAGNNGAKADRYFQVSCS